MIRFRQFQIALALVFGLIALSCAGAAKHSASGDKNADRMASRLIGSLGGESRLNKIRFLQFEITDQSGGRISKRAYWFDRQRNLCRLEGKLRTGTPFAALLDIGAHKGQTFVGIRYRPSQDPAILQEAFADEAADMKWLFGVMRLLEPGSRLQSLGTKNFFSQASPTLDWTSSGPSPIRRLYHLRTDGTGVIGSTEFTGNAPSRYVWTQWQKLHGVQLPVRFEHESSSRKIVIENLLAPKTIADEIFNRP